MIYCIQAKYYDMIMYANFQCMNVHGFLQIIASSLDFLEFYIMHYGSKDDEVKSFG
jgi:hypothetical protein